LDIANDIYIPEDIGDGGPDHDGRSDGWQSWFLNLIKKSVSGKQPYVDSLSIPLNASRLAFIWLRSVTREICSVGEPFPKNATLFRTFVAQFLQRWIFLRRWINYSYRGEFFQSINVQNLTDQKPIISPFETFSSNVNSEREAASALKKLCWKPVGLRKSHPCDVQKEIFTWKCQGWTDEDTWQRFTSLNLKTRCLERTALSSKSILRIPLDSVFTWMAVLDLFVIRIWVNSYFLRRILPRPNPDGVLNATE
jgi:hypothetical protein